MLMGWAESTLSGVTQVERGRVSVYGEVLASDAGAGAEPDAALVSTD